jgi:hypothetical protein
MVQVATAGERPASAGRRSRAYSARWSLPGSGWTEAARTAHRGSEAVLAAQPGAFFTIPHFDGYPAVLIQPKSVSRTALREAITDGWLACAPSRLVNDYLMR